MTNIPILNIYYLLCYAWDKLEEAEQVPVGATDTNQLLDLFAKVLAGRLRWLFQKGLDRNYLNTTDEVFGLKGKLNFAETLKHNTLRKHHTVCQFDEFEYNILPNQILKTTVAYLLKTAALDKKISDELWQLYFKFPPIDEIKLRAADFQRVVIHRNNYHYDFLLKICEIIHQNLLIDESKGQYQFKDFLRDEKAMARLFEAFICNFYRNETTLQVRSSEQIKWQFDNVSSEAQGMIPIMQTDISLYGKTQKLIIDAKYYKEAFVKRYDTEKFRTPNLYQLFAYLINQQADTEMSQTCGGMLLYPATYSTFAHEMYYQKHRIGIQAINLNQEWPLIKADLLALVAELR